MKFKENSKNTKIINHLLSGRNIDKDQALELYSVMRLSKTISYLKSLGFKIYRIQKRRNYKGYDLEYTMDEIQYKNSYKADKNNKQTLLKSRRKYLERKMSPLNIKLIEYLKANKQITSLQVFKLFGNVEISTRIAELKRYYGYKIESKKGKSEKKRFTIYTLID